MINILGISEVQREQTPSSQTSDEASDAHDQDEVSGSQPVKIGKKKQARLLEKEEKKTRRLV